MLPVSQSEQIILNLAKSLDLKRDCEHIDLSQSLGRILAESPRSKLDFPHWHNSAMDGYAVRYQDLKGCSAEAPVSLTIVDQISAGKIAQVEVKANQAARIFTGAMMPPGADTIVIQEDTKLNGENQVQILTAPQPQQFVRHQADFAKVNTALLEIGTKIGAAEIAILAAAQCVEVRVFRPLRVAIFSTGDELITIDQTLSAGQIVDSNQYAISAFAIAAGAIVINLGIIKDNPEALKKVIISALDSADIIISSGGVSVGDYDYVEQVLAELGAKIHLRSVAIKPGKPLTVATFEREQGNPIVYFGLPGNPVSALVSCWRFVSSALKKMSGLKSDAIGIKFIRCQTQSDLTAAANRETYIWGKLEIKDGSHQFIAAPGMQNSGNLINLAYTNALAIAPLGSQKILKHSMVEVMQIN